MRKLITASDIERRGLEWCYADELQKKLSSLPIHTPVVVNTDLSGGPGVHWIVVMKLRGSARYIYDPLGPDNELMSSSGVPTGSLIKTRGSHVYPYDSQIDSTSLCGYFSILIATKMEGMTSSAAIDAMIQDYFGKSADWGDVQTLRKAL